MKRPMHPNSLNNLKPCKKGEVRNPLGAGAAKRRREFERQKIFEKIADKNDLSNNKNHTNWEAAVIAMFIKAIGGDPVSFKQICDRLCGKVAEPVEVSGPDGDRLGVVILPAKEK